MNCFRQDVIEDLHATRRTLVQNTPGLSEQARQWPQVPPLTNEDGTQAQQIERYETVSTMGAANLREKADATATHQMPSVPAVEAFEGESRRGSTASANYEIEPAEPGGEPLTQETEEITQQTDEVPQQVESQTQEAEQPTQLPEQATDGEEVIETVEKTEQVTVDYPQDGGNAQNGNMQSNYRPRSSGTYSGQGIPGRNAGSNQGFPNGHPQQSAAPSQGMPINPQGAAPIRGSRSQLSGTPSDQGMARGSSGATPVYQNHSQATAAQGVPNAQGYVPPRAGSRPRISGTASAVGIPGAAVGPNNPLPKQPRDDEEVIETVEKTEQVTVDYPQDGGNAQNGNMQSNYRLRSSGTFSGQGIRGTNAASNQEFPNNHAQQGMPINPQGAAPIRGSRSQLFGTPSDQGMARGSTGATPKYQNRSQAAAAHGMPNAQGTAPARGGSRPRLSGYSSGQGMPRVSAAPNQAMGPQQGNASGQLHQPVPRRSRLGGTRADPQVMQQNVAAAQQSQPTASGTTMGNSQVNPERPTLGGAPRPMDDGRHFPMDANQDNGLGTSSVVSETVTRRRTTRRSSVGQPLPGEEVQENQQEQSAQGPSSSQTPQTATEPQAPQAPPGGSGSQMNQGSSRERRRRRMRPSDPPSIPEPPSESATMVEWMQFFVTFPFKVMQYVGWLSKIMYQTTRGIQRSPAPQCTLNTQ